MPLFLEKITQKGLRVTAYRYYSPNNDKSVLDTEGYDRANREGGGVVDNNYYVFGVGVKRWLLMFSSVMSFFCFFYFLPAFFGVGGDKNAYNFIGMLACGFGGVYLFEHSFRYKYKKFVVLDRARGLVHIPRFWGRGYDRIRFEDAGFAVIHVPSLYGTSYTVHFQIVRAGHELLRGKNGRPGWELMKREVKDGVGRGRRLQWRHHRIELQAGGPIQAKQRLWAYLVDFMNHEAEPIPGGTAYARSDQLAKYLPRLVNFDPKMLKDDITWWRDEQGNWHKVDGAAGKFPPQLHFRPNFAPPLDDWLRE